MRTAKKSKLAMNMFWLVQQYMLKRSFGKVFVKVEQPIQSNALYIVNHSSWWDGLLLFELERKGYIPNAYVMVDEKGMERVPIFQWIGAYSVDQHNSKHIMQSIRYTESLLQNGKNVCLFPQGEERHLEERPLQFQHGAAVISKRLNDVPVVPVTFYYTFRDKAKAEAWIVIGKPIEWQQNFNRQQLTQHFEEVVTAQLDALKKSVMQNDLENFDEMQ